MFKFRLFQRLVCHHWSLSKFGEVTNLNRWHRRCGFIVDLETIVEALQLDWTSILIITILTIGLTVAEPANWNTSIITRALVLIVTAVWCFTLDRLVLMNFYSTIATQIGHLLTFAFSLSFSFTRNNLPLSIWITFKYWVLYRRLWPLDIRVSINTSSTAKSLDLLCNINLVHTNQVYRKLMKNRKTIFLWHISSSSLSSQSVVPSQR